MFHFFVAMARARAQSTARTLAVLLIACLAGCASGPDYPAVQGELPRELVGASPSSPSEKRIVVLRFPYSLDEASAAELRRRFNAGAYYGFVGQDGYREPDEKTLDAAVAKTSYYAFKLYDAMRARLPGATVVLQPVALRMNGSTVQYAGDFQSLAPAVVVDFFAYVWPRWQPDLVQPFATMGRTLVPVVSIRTMPEVSAGTRGAVAGMHYLAGIVAPGAGAGAYAGAGASIRELMNTPAQDAFVQVSSMVAASTHAQARPWTPDRFVIWPTLKLTMTPDEMRAPNELANQPSVEALANVVGDALRSVDGNAAAERALLSLSALPYDPDAASLVRDGGRLDARREKLIRSFVAAEQKFLDAQAQALSDRMARGEWNASFRTTRDAEQSSLSKAKAVGWLGLLAAGVIGNPGVTLAMGQSLDSSFMAWASSMQTAMIDVRDEQLSIALDEVGAEAEISASSLVELRAKLLSIYRKRMQSAALAQQ